MASQLTFDELRRARATDPATSKAAAAASHGLAADHRRAILAVMRSARCGLAACEIAERCGLTSVQVSRRLRELVDDGQLLVTGYARETPSGRPAQTYEAVLA